MSAPNPELDHDLIKKRARVITATWLTVGLFVILVVSTLVGLSINGYQGAQTRKLLIDCVTPSGECAQRNAKETAKVVDQLIKANALDEVATRNVVIFAAVCSQQENVQRESDFNTRVHLMEVCINEQLEIKAEQKESAE